MAIAHFFMLKILLPLLRSSIAELITGGVANKIIKKTETIICLI